MPKIKLRQDGIDKLPKPEKGNVLYHDEATRGLAVRVTKAGHRAYVFWYRTKKRRERLYTIGDCDSWKLEAARTEARSLRTEVDKGGDPLEGLQADRDAKTMEDLAKLFKEQHFPKLRASTKRDYTTAIDKHILPQMKKLKVADVTHADVEKLHRKITKKGRPYVANRVCACLSKMFSYAVKKKWCTDNPVKGLERNQEHKRERYLSVDEIERLSEALAEHKDQQAANIIRLLLLTGARSEEVRGMRWDGLDLENGVWIKIAAYTKQKKYHRVPLSAPARQLLSQIREEAERTAKEKGKEVSEYVFPSHSKKGYRDDIQPAWRALCKAAGIVTTEIKKGPKGRKRQVVKPSARIHDLRHSYASHLVSDGLSLPIIGALLGHTQAQTTQRYAHLMDDPLRKATERLGAIVTGSDDEKTTWKIVDIGQHRRA